MRTLEFVLILILGAALILVLRDDLRLRDANDALTLRITALQGATSADTVSASQGQLRCSTEARSAVNVGRAIGRIAAPRRANPHDGQSMVSAADIRSVVQP